MRLEWRRVRRLELGVLQSRPTRFFVPQRRAASADHVTEKPPSARRQTPVIAFARSDRR